MGRERRQPVRVDKFLKVSRLIKRRTVAKEVAEAGRILLNGRLAKPGSEVKPGDRLEVLLGGQRLLVEILDVPERGRTVPVETLYRLEKVERLP